MSPSAWLPQTRVDPSYSLDAPTLWQQQQQQRQQRSNGAAEAEAAAAAAAAASSRLAIFGILTPAQCTNTILGAQWAAVKLIECENEFE